MHKSEEKIGSEEAPDGRRWGRSTRASERGSCWGRGCPGGDRGCNLPSDLGNPTSFPYRSPSFVRHVPLFGAQNI